MSATFEWKSEQANILHAPTLLDNDAHYDLNYKQISIILGYIWSIDNCHICVTFGHKLSKRYLIEQVLCLWHVHSMTLSTKLHKVSQNSVEQFWGVRWQVHLILANFLSSKGA